MSAPLLEVEDVVRRFAAPRTSLWPGRRRTTTAVDGVSFSIGRGEAFGLVGESGSGKSTLARMAVGLLEPSDGALRLDGRPVRARGRAERRALWRRIQLVHQDPRGALNPRLPVGRIVGGPLESLHGVTGAERDRRVARALERVGIDPASAARRPHAFSGGQAQRIAIARAIAAEPELLVLDEPTSALDVRVQAGVLRLLDGLRRELGMSLLFISHDLPVVAAVCDRVGVMRRGRLVECGPRERVFEQPADAYTRRLLDSIPDLGDRVR